MNSDFSLSLSLSLSRVLLPGDRPRTMARKREEHDRGNTNAAPRARANAPGPTENWEDRVRERRYSHPPSDDYRPIKDSYILLAWKSGEIVIHFLRDFFICFLLSTLWQHLR
jgi:hypothetical protein